MYFFFVKDTATTEIYTLSLHDALPICFLDVPETVTRIMIPGRCEGEVDVLSERFGVPAEKGPADLKALPSWFGQADRSEEHTSELQSRQYLVCRLLLEKKK